MSLIQDKSVEPQIELKETSASVMAKAFQDGSLIILNIGGETWKRALTKEMLGVKKVDSVVRLGQVQILPDEPIQKIRSIEGAARRYLEFQSLAFGSQHRANFRFVPDSVRIETLVELGDLRDEYFRAVEDLISKLPAYRASMKENHADLWPYIAQFHQESDVAIRNSYYFNFENLEMKMAKNVEGVDLDELLRRQKIEQTVTAEFRAKAQKALDYQAEQARQRATEFVETTIRGFRTQALKAFQHISEKLKEKKPLRKDNVDKIFSVIANIRALDFLGDTAFHTKLNEIETLVDSRANLKDDAEAVRELETLLNNAVTFVNETTESTVVANTKAYFSRNLKL
jgi:hypothetical protein